VPPFQMWSYSKLHIVRAGKDGFRLTLGRSGSCELPARPEGMEASGRRESYGSGGPHVCLHVPSRLW
jgi:hypothetical protein